uniref:Uncharacterized protein n=1 Tax=Arundo donax TaxID=35708 RepID=A0A0A9G0X7_ARUDO
MEDTINKQFNICGSYSVSTKAACDPLYILYNTYATISY